MSTPNAASRRRGGRGGRSGSHSGGHSASNEAPAAASAATASAKPASDVCLSQHPVQNLPFLHELLRPAAASRIAAAARAVHMEGVESSPPQPPSLSAAAFTPHGGAASSTSAPPPAYGDGTPQSRAASSHRTSPSANSAVASAVTHTHLDVNALAFPAATSSAGAVAIAVPPLPLVVECAAQLSGMLVQWRASSDGARRRPPTAPAPPPSGKSSAAPPGTTTTTTTTTTAAPSAAAIVRGAAKASATTAAAAAAESQPARPSPQRLLQLMELVLWYCLSTAEDARLVTGGRSRGTSGLATPAPPGANAGAGGGGAMAGAGGGGGAAGGLALMGGSSTPFGLRGGRSGSASVGTTPYGGLRGGGSVGARSGSCSADPMGAQDWLGSRMSTASSTTTAPAFTMSDDQLAEQLFRPVVDAVVILQRQANAGQSATPSAAATKGKKEAESDASAATALELQTTALWTLAAALVRFAEAPFNATVFLPVLFPQVDVRGASGAAARHPLLQPLLHGGPLNTSLRCGAAAALTALLHKLRPTLQYAEEPQPGRQAAFLSLASQCGTILAALHEGLSWGLTQALPADAKESAAAAATAASAAPGAGANTAALPSSAIAVPVLNTLAAVALVTPYHRCPRSRGVILQTLEQPVLHFFLAHDEVSAYVPATVLASNLLKNESMRGAAAQLLVTAESAAPPSPASAADDAPGGFLPALLRHADTRVEVWRCMVPLSRLYPRLVHTEFDVLMAASAKVVAALAGWEAAEEAADAAEWAAGRGSGGGGGIGTARGQRTPAASAATTPSRPTRGDGEGRTSATQADARATSATRSRVPTATLEAFTECLRSWLHFMGYVWKAFDDNASDPAQRPESQGDRATLAQKRRIHEDLLRPAMCLRRCGEEVRTMTLRCIAQIGNDYVSTITDRSRCEEFVAYVQASAADAQPRVRGEALTTLGVWLWQYTAMDTFAGAAIDSAVHALTVDPNPVVRTKAAFALSNVTGRLPEGTCAVVRDAPDYIATLCATAMHAAVIDTENGVQGHGIRMMSHLLQVLTFEELISEVEEFEEGVAEGFLRVLLECLRATTRGGPNRGNDAEGDGAGRMAGLRHGVPREAKHRWNAAYALGMGLAREEVFEAEPKYAVEAVEALCTAVVRDHIFKVRTQAAGALGRIPGHCLSGTYSAADLTPTVVSSLCKALETATSTENFRQFKEQGSLHEALRSALAVMITSATPSNELEKVFTSHRKLLEKEALL